VLLIKVKFFFKLTLLRHFSGLSSFADDPKSAADSIGKLLHAAKRHIPQDQWPKTPITLKATAGSKASFYFAPT
jgi:Golgi nucleoside diphosphatase